MKRGVLITNEQGITHVIDFLDEDEARKKFAKWLADERTRQGMRPEELARRVGVTHTAIYWTERGNSLPKLTTLVRIMAALSARLEIRS